MKRNNDFLLKNVAGKQVLVPVGRAAAAFPGMVSVNSSGAYIWELLENDMTMEQLVAAMVQRYEVAEEAAQKDAGIFIDRLRTVKAVTD